jgi:hypothetical protein
MGIDAVIAAGASYIGLQPIQQGGGNDGEQGYARRLPPEPEMGTAYQPPPPVNRIDHHGSTASASNPGYPNYPGQSGYPGADPSGANAGGQQPSASWNFDLSSIMQLVQQIMSLFNQVMASTNPDPLHEGSLPFVGVPRSTTGTPSGSNKAPVYGPSVPPSAQGSASNAANRASGDQGADSPIVTAKQWGSYLLM